MELDPEVSNSANPSEIDALRSELALMEQQMALAQIDRNLQSSNTTTSAQPANPPTTTARPATNPTATPARPTPCWQTGLIRSAKACFSASSFRSASTGYRCFTSTSCRCFAFNSGSVEQTNEQCTDRPK